MRCTFKTKWVNNEIACICTLKNKCIHASQCEELEFKMSAYDDMKECMRQRAYKRLNGSIKQVRHG